MKRIVSMFWLMSSLVGGFAQGTVDFLNNPATLITSGNPLTPVVIGSSPGAYFFGLLTSPVGANTFSFSGIYGTNGTVAGIFNGGSRVPVSGWLPGTARDFEVVGWAAYLGPGFNPAWLTTPPYVGEMVAWGVSPVGTGVAGGVTSSGTLPSLSIFGGAPSIQQGFNINTYSVVAEPSGLALAGLALFYCSFGGDEWKEAMAQWRLGL